MIEWRVLKFPISAADIAADAPIEIKMPAVVDSRDITFAFYRNQFTIWARCAMVEEPYIQRFFIHGTGAPCPSPEQADLIGSVQIDDLLAYHLFRVKPGATI